MVDWFRNRVAPLRMLAATPTSLIERPLMEIVILIFLIVLNGVFAMSEMAVVSSRKSRLQQWADEGRRGAAAALSLANEPSNFLSTIQVGITVIGITSGAFGEAKIAKPFAQYLGQWPLIAPYAEAIALTLVIAGITVTSIIVGELVPKRLALLKPEVLASAIAKPMQWLAALTHPLVRMLSFVTEVVIRLLGARQSKEPAVTEEEIHMLMDQGAEEGVFEEHEQAIVSRVFRLDKLKVTGVMTSRVDIVYLDLEHSAEETLRLVIESDRSHFPVTRGGLDHVEGMVKAQTLLRMAASGQPVDLASSLRKVLFIPQALTVMEVVESFKKHRQTLALAVNEFGDVQGIVTLHDVMEALVGDIATLDQPEGEIDIIRRDDGSWLVDGGVTIDRFKDVVGIHEPLSGEGSGFYQTVGGFAMTQLGNIPRVGDKFNWNRFGFEIVDMDKNRVDKLIVTSTEPKS
jgi:putative hemolysin